MNTKKKMSFTAETNSEFIALSIIAILYGLDRVNESKKFKYSQKLSTMIYFINSYDNVNLFKLACENDYTLKMSDYENLNNIFLKSKIIEPQVNRILNALKVNGFIETLIYNDEVCIYINKEKCSFIKEEIYDDLVLNTKDMQKNYRYISSVKYQSYFKKIFRGFVANE